MQPKALEGTVVEPAGDSAELLRLRELNRSLTRELSDALAENEDLRKRVANADAPVARLREKLEPFYKLLQAIFGDIEDLGLDENISPATNGHKQSHAPIWDSWKDKVSATAAKIITALQEHSDLNTQQLAIVTKLHRTTIPKGIYELNKAGLINKSGGRFSLKQL